MKNEKSSLMKFLIYDKEGGKVLTIISLLIFVVSFCITIFSDVDKAPNLAYKVGFDYSLMIGLPVIAYITDVVKRVSHYALVCAISIFSYSIALSQFPGIVLVNVPIVITSLVIMLTFHTYLNLMWFDYMVEDIITSTCDSLSLRKIFSLNVKTGTTFSIVFVFVVFINIYLSTTNTFGFHAIDKTYSIVAVIICILVQVLRIMTNKNIMNGVYDKLKITM